MYYDLLNCVDLNTIAINQSDVRNNFKNHIN